MAKMMAFGGVAAGRMKANEVARTSGKVRQKGCIANLSA